MDYVRKIEEIRVSKRLSQSEISKQIGISQQVYSNFINGATLKPPVKIVEFITNNIVNNENIAKDQQSSYPTNYIDLRKNKKLFHQKKKTVPFYDDVSATASNLPSNMSSINYPSESIDVGDLLSDSHAAIRIYSNSMLPNYPPGCVVGVVQTTSTFIQPGEVYVIETDDQRLLKRLFYKDDDPESSVFVCYSDNTMKFEGGARAGKEAYPPFHLPKKSIKKMFIVTGVIKRNTNSLIINRK